MSIMNGSLFWRQFVVLVWKNWIVLWRYRWLNLLRCLALPIGYGIFLAVAQIFLTKPNDYGIGSPIPILSLQQEYNGATALVWADGTNGTTNPTPDDIMSHVTRGFTAKQLQGVKKVTSPDDIPLSCQENFNLFSECYAGIAFTSLPSTDPKGPQTIEYTLRGDGGLFHIDVVHHKSDYEKRIMPLQWAVDSALIELTTGIQVPTPLEWPFTQETNKEQSTDTRLSYIRGIRKLLVLALYICYIGIVYQLPGSFMGERANLLTSHLKAMGLLDSARIISWHISISLAYLPAWIIVAIIWHFQIFSSTSVVLVLLIHLLFPLSLASWSFFVAAPFGKSPQLAAVASTFLAIVFAVLALVLEHVGNGAAFIYSVVFPPGFYVFAIRAVCGWENNHLGTNAVKPDPDRGLTLLPLLIAAIIDIFLWPWLAVLWEHQLYDPRNPRESWRSWRCWGKRRVPNETETHTIPPNVAISIRNLGKDFRGKLFGSKKGNVTAIADLTLDIPKFGIYVLLGSNGAGKSTALSILAGLSGRTRGSILFEGNETVPPRGTIGIVPQKNVLFPELTCHQTLRVWREVKRTAVNGEEEDIEQLLRDCDLGKKIHYDASKLSGGQKRKLQLAIGLIGGSKIVLVDECTSGVDPLSRRALWRILTSVRDERTIVFTTHFLDEADLLADYIAVLAAPGKLVAEGTPVSLKSRLGEGYTVHVTFNSAQLSDEKQVDGPCSELLALIRVLAPSTYVAFTPPHDVAYHLKSQDSQVVQKVLRVVEEGRKAYHIASYSVLGTSIEDVFLGLMHAEAPSAHLEKVSSATPSQDSLPKTLELTTGRPRSPLSQAFTIFHKRVLVMRRSWLTPVLAILVAVCGSCIPLFYLSGRTESCQTTFDVTADVPLYLPNSTLGLGSALGGVNPPGSQVLMSPPGVLSILGPTIQSVQTANVTDNSTFVDDVTQNFRNLSIGGVSFDLASSTSLVAWEASPPGLTGLILLNLATNVLFNNVLISSGNGSAVPALIMAQYESFPGIDSETLTALQWVAFFGAAMSVYPAFFAMYVSRERRSSVQAMQLSNGLSNPVGLWLGHLLFDSIFSIITATVIIIVFAAVGEVSSQFHGLGFFWLILFLYGVVGTLLAYCMSLFAASPLAAFAITAGYQVVMFVLYLAGYLLTVTYAKTSQAASDLTIIHFTMSLLSPVASLLRTSFVSVNLFSLLCSGSDTVSTSSMATIMRYGGPILYLILYAFVLFGVLVWVDTGSSLLIQKLTFRGRLASRADTVPVQSSTRGEDVEREVDQVATSTDSLRVLNIAKTFGFGSASNKVVDGVSFGVSRDTIFALLGPNGAGKTTTFNVIRGEVTPDEGDVLINGISIVRHPRLARLSLGVCPQFTAIDSQLTVREHLMIYGRLKGLYRGEELNRNVAKLMEATSLLQYADRLATKLSGGNQRKLSLAIALIGNPSVILIDEFSTGVDAKMKREMWTTLRNVSVGKAIVITTHSMEEASALANKVGILARKMLAVGTTDDLSARYATYEVHFSCRSREEVVHAQELMTRIPGSRMADDVATRFQVPVNDEMPLSQLFAVLSSEGGFAEYTVEKATLESIFLRVIRDNNVLEDQSDTIRRDRRWRLC